MKRLCWNAVVVLFVVQGFLGQESLIAPKALSPIEFPQSYPIPGCRVLRQEEMKIQRYLKEHPEVLHEQRMMKRTAWNFQVGDKGPIQGGWWATNLQTNSEYQVPSTCRSVTSRAYIFVEDSLWDVGRVDQAAVDSIRIAWEQRTPASSTKGIYQLDVETFGDPPDVDTDPRIIILILDIKDGFTGSGGYVAGYFFSINQFRDGTFSGRRSNFAEIYYLDGNPLDLKKPSGIAFGASTTAHEFQHMIHWNYDRSEITFINEACSEVASLVCGYSYPGQNLYTDNTDVYLLGWNNSLQDYSRAARWALYLWNQFPNGYLRLLVQDGGVGITGMNNAFAAHGTQRRFDDVFVDWLVANQVNDAAVNARYAYTFASPLTKPKATTYFNPNIGPQNASVNQLAADYIGFTGGSNLSITFTSSSLTLLVKAVKVGANTKQVVDVPLNTPYTEPAFGSTYSAIAFIVINTSQSSSASYSYQATGTSQYAFYEIKHDNGNGLGALTGLSANDTIAVYFDAIPGAILDSIRIAFRQLGSIDVGIWTYTGDLRPRPLGAVLVPTFNINVAASDTNTRPTTEETTKWIAKDLRSFNILLNSSFVVAAVLGVNPTKPGIMVTKAPHTGGPNHSYTYLNNPGAGRSPDWYYLTADEGVNVWLYMIRAYVHVGSPPTGFGDVIELVAKTFAIQQNFPNPFNPSTTIRYEIPEKSHVRLQVVDLLGRVMATLVDQVQSAGSYQAIWDGQNVNGVPASSGIYFYRLETSSGVKSREMVLIR